ncbi:poly-gamma-glutamate biosynthesis protein PgsC/CapC [Salinarchaeum laminariae]|uniref:poly-gamma-glutamate biosynthesis protein PgsC/CapC n=1 Tax=Salinarchaeum laminariae TaxID=869888 RepID=UPI0020BD5467|nr:poly-gamma-glutamate biosynthesis protein PgsC/CapC [Salinarchaeum laminariae]
MIVAVLIALLGLGVVAASARPGDGRAETAIALPLVAAVSVIVPAIVLVALAGAGLAFLALAVVERRTLLHGRRLRAVAAGAGAVVPLGTLAVATALGEPPAYPELWLVGAVVPGVLADDLRRQPAAERNALAVGGVTALFALVLSGLVLRGAVAGADPGQLAAASAVGGVGVGELAVLAAVLVLALVAGTLARWRYALHTGALSVPLLAVWSLESVAVPLAFLAAGLVSALAIGLLQPRLRLSSRRLGATVGLLGATVGGVAAVLGAPALPAVLAGAFGAEDARLLGYQAGADLLDGLALGGALYVIAVVVLGATAGIGGPLPGILGGLGVVVALGTAGLVLARRERERPSEVRLRAAEGRWPS